MRKTKTPLSQTRFLTPIYKFSYFPFIVLPVFTTCSTSVDVYPISLLHQANLGLLSMNYIIDIELETSRLLLHKAQLFMHYAKKPVVIFFCQSMLPIIIYALKAGCNKKNCGKMITPQEITSVNKNRNSPDIYLYF